MIKLPNIVWLTPNDWTWEKEKIDVIDVAYIKKEDYDKLVTAVLKMRKHQKDYFRTRSSDSLALSKHQESIVDSLLNPTLFEGT